MIDLLLKWKTKELSVQCGQALGATTEDENGEFQTAPYLNGLNIAVIGPHVQIDNSDPENPTSQSDGNHWIIIRVPVEFTLPVGGNDYTVDEILTQVLPEAIRPEVVWRSDSEDAGGPIPRPDISTCPQVVWS